MNSKRKDGKKGASMRNKLLFLLTIMVILTVGFISGCGGCGCQDEHDNTEYHIENLENLNEQYSSMLPTEAELGVPVYSDNLDPSSVESSKTETDGEVTDVGATTPPRTISRPSSPGTKASWESPRNLSNCPTATTRPGGTWRRTARASRLH